MRRECEANEYEYRREAYEQLCWTFAPADEDDE
jgi:hypothetical protein